MTAKARHSAIGDAIVEEKYEEAATAIVAALVSAGGSQTAAANTLNVSDRTMRRWIAVLDEHALDVRVLAKKAGVELLVRRPRTRRRSRKAA